MKEPGDQMGVLKSHPASFGGEGGPERGPSRKLGDEITVNSPHLRKLELYFYPLDECTCWAIHMSTHEAGGAGGSHVGPPHHPGTRTVFKQSVYGGTTAGPESLGAPQGRLCRLPALLGFSCVPTPHSCLVVVFFFPSQHLHGGGRGRPCWPH